MKREYTSSSLGRQVNDDPNAETAVEDLLGAACNAELFSENPMMRVISALPAMRRSNVIEPQTEHLDKNVLSFVGREHWLRASAMEKFAKRGSAA